MSGKYIGIVTILLALGAFGLGSSLAGNAESAAEGGAPSAEEAAPPPRSPLRLSTVDFQDTVEGSGKLKLAGIALPGRDLYLFLDDEPIATVTPDDGGNWSFERTMMLDDGRHTLRADQYDQATDMLAARAMVTIQRAKPEAPKSEATSP